MIDDTKIRDAIKTALNQGPLAETVQEVQIEDARDEDDDEFLRVMIFMRMPDKDVDAELETLLQNIEDAVAAVDDRYPSVRFLDAA